MLVLASLSRRRAAGCSGTAFDALPEQSGGFARLEIAMRLRRIRQRVALVDLDADATRGHMVEDSAAFSAGSAM